MEENIKTNKLSLIISIILTLVFTALTIYATILAWPYMKELDDPTKRIEFQTMIQGYGFWGIVVMVLMQVIQVVIAFIPGEIVEIMMGMMYGVIGGIFFCWVGLAIATVIIFYLVKLIGKPIINFFVSEKQREKYKFLRDSKRAEALFLFAFLLPGTPKDVLIYLAPATKVKLSRFLVLSLIGRIPSLLLSALIGHYFVLGHYGKSIWYSVLTVVMAVLGIVFYKPIINFLEHKVLRSKNEESI